MTASPLVYIAMVNYGRADDTIECLKSLHGLTGVDFRVVLVDNDSPDGSVQYLNAWFDAGEPDGSGWITLGRVGQASFDLKFVASPDNTGFAGGCNIGIREALADPDCTHVWLLNNDTLVEPDSLSALIHRFDRDDRVGICGSTLVYHQPEDIVQGCGGRFDMVSGRGTPIGAFRERGTLPAPDEVEREMDYVIGASMLVSMDLIRSVGEMDERYFLYFEELDWALRARRGGFALGWAPDSVVIHKEGAAIGTSTRGRPSVMATYFMTVGYLRLIRAHRVGVLPLALALSLARAVKWALAGDQAHSRTVVQGIRDFLQSPSRYVAGSYHGMGSKIEGQ
ncbi:glycosyltransferase family 2 protein [Novosphingobium sp. BL-52-GroH]|uniref:glycosyltransferase family 2 protein n=1 Tax=Novosphingobium sp. BL-52-GroH TaxID=3349877 RepID=UPI00384B3690